MTEQTTERKTDQIPMPAAFIGHGTPMNAIEENKYSKQWRTFGEAIPRPRAILVISAHWYTNATMVTAMSKPRTIHDFFGFPQKLFDVEYPAPGLPDLAGEVAEILKPSWVGMDEDSWGLDHGTWSVLKHVFPKADIPVVQLSINAHKPMEYHLELASKLHELRKSGVLIVGSGNVVHNLRRMDFRLQDEGYDWAQRFDDDVFQQMMDAPGDILKLLKNNEARHAIPSPDHFIPLLYLSGLSAEADQEISTFARGYAYGSISMTSYALGLDDIKGDSKLVTA